MPLSLERNIQPDIIYPDSDGQPMAENTLQFKWIILIKENLECLFADDPNVFVAGDLLWYPVKGQPEIRVTPDAMAAFGRPKGYWGSYQQWEEGNIAPQVVVEVLSPGSTATEVNRKLAFYDRYLTSETLEINDPNGQRFQTMIEMRQNLAIATQQAEAERLRAEQERERAEQLRTKLLELGVDPESGSDFDDHSLSQSLRSEHILQDFFRVI
ncbi:Uma2 family endonuclease [Synechococcus sp. PCC 6312]|uniref:Uma2 family endonuclease n=1 Tax=Synechococcus sp. (strain ATCC 27167 / PCC 6312) TaxID=195253 RepID=UPI000900588C|nr:Uma2 family endonuclease [Synechococcus sp. PCC 6312]